MNLTDMAAKASPTSTVWSNVRDLGEDVLRLRSLAETIHHSVNPCPTVLCEDHPMPQSLGDTINCIREDVAQISQTLQWVLTYLGE